MTMHSLTKSAIFFAVGHIAQVKGTQRIADIRGLTVTHPVLGWGLVLGVIAIAGLPPFGVFMSEFLIVSSTFARAPLARAFLLVGGLLVAFGALLLRLQGMAFGAPAGPGVKEQASYLPMIAHFALGADGGRLFAAGRSSPGSSTSPAYSDRRRNHADASRDLRQRAGGREPQAMASPFGRLRSLAFDGGAGRRGTMDAVGLWGDKDAVHMALLDEAAHQFAIITRPCPKSYFPSLGLSHPPAIRLERAIRDLYGLEPRGLPDQRPWLDHGRWGVRHPLSAHPGPAVPPEPYPFLPVEGASLDQIPVGPVHAGIIEPGHFRFTANGEAVVRLEERLGYTHKGVDGLIRRRLHRTGGEARRADIRRQHGRLFAGVRARGRGGARRSTSRSAPSWLRALMAELERLANHFGDIGAICNDAAFALMLAHCGVLRERVLRAAAACFGHRLMMDRDRPGRRRRRSFRHGRSVDPRPRRRRAPRLSGARRAI